LQTKEKHIPLAYQQGDGKCNDTCDSSSWMPMIASKVPNALRKTISGRVLSAESTEISADEEAQSDSAGQP
jgi:hypothetical protein